MLLSKTSFLNPFWRRALKKCLCAKMISKRFSCSLYTPVHKLMEPLHEIIIRVLRYGAACYLEGLEFQFFQESYTHLHLFFVPSTQVLVRMHSIVAKMLLFSTLVDLPIQTVRQKGSRLNEL